MSLIEMDFIFLTHTKALRLSLKQLGQHAANRTLMPDSLISNVRTSLNPSPLLEIMKEIHLDDRITILGNALEHYNSTLRAVKVARKDYADALTKSACHSHIESAEKRFKDLDGEHKKRSKIATLLIGDIHRDVFQLTGARASVGLPRLQLVA